MIRYTIHIQGEEVADDTLIMFDDWHAMAAHVAESWAHDECTYHDHDVEDEDVTVRFFDSSGLLLAEALVTVRAVKVVETWHDVASVTAHRDPPSGPCPRTLPLLAEDT
jgi:hypothetical protein